MRLSRFAFAAPALLALLYAGCGSETSASPKKTPPADPAAIAAKLAAADAADGKVDKIVEKCAACGLGMDGKAESTMTIEGYTLYFCKPGERDAFAKDAETKILALAVPGK